MKFNKKDLLEYDYSLYQKEYHRIEDDLNSNNYRNEEDLTKDDLKAWLDKGIFTRRLKFRNAKENFYITTATIRRGKIGNPDYKFGDDYLLSYWSDNSQRAETLMKFEIGDESPANGELDLIGEYHPNNENLLNIKYQTRSGKEFIKNAKNFLEGIDEDDVVYKIDIEKFFRLNFELAGQGLQAQALYSEDNCIIEGMAGTGKSTIALQKLKYFYEKHNILQEQMIVIVKNFKLKSHFLTLLEDKNIDLKRIKILSLNEVYKNRLQEKDFINFKNTSLNIKKDIERFINLREIKTLSNHYYNLFNYIGIDFFRSLLQKKIESLNTSENLTKLEHLTISINELNQIKTLNDEEKNTKNNITKEINKISPLRFEKILKMLDSKYQFSVSVLEDLIKLIDFSDTLLFNCETLKWIIEYKNYLINLSKLEQKKKDLVSQLNNNLPDSKINEIKSNLSKIEEQLKKSFPFATREYLSKFSLVMNNVYLNEKYISNTYLSTKTSEEREIITRYLNLSKREYKIVIVDEAQDFEKDELEYIRLLTDKIFLTGDMLQNLNNSNGLKNWNDILFVDDIFEKDSKLNIFNLKHNYRQTYQLANSSFNFRNILLQRELEDIGDDYFENEKKFGDTEYFKPSITFAYIDDEVYNLVYKSLISLLNTYTSRFPLVIVAKNIEHKDYYLNLFKDHNLNDSANIINSDIIVYTIDEIKGEQFPIVFANTSMFTSKEIYLIMSRAQFELKLYFQDYNSFNKPMFDLMTNQLNLIDIDEIIDLNKIKLDTNQNDIANTDKNDGELINEKDDLIENDEEIYDIEVDDIQFSNQDDSVDLEDNEINFDLEKAIGKHNRDIENKKRDLNPSIIKKQDEYLNKVKEQFEKNYENSSLMKKYTVTVNIKNGYKETKDFLLKQYDGYCQICGFTFKKEKDRQNYFQHFNWFSNKISKQKVNFIDPGSSLCLCSKCYSIAKYGSFESIFLDNMRKVDFNSKNQSFDKFCESINEKTILIDIPECFDFIEMDMYKIPVKMLEEENYIFYTEEHFLHFYNLLTISKINE